MPTVNWLGFRGLTRWGRYFVKEDRDGRKRLAYQPHGGDQRFVDEEGGNPSTEELKRLADQHAAGSDLLHGGL